MMDQSNDYPSSKEATINDMGQIDQYRTDERKSEGYA